MHRRFPGSGSELTLGCDPLSRSNRPKHRQPLHPDRHTVMKYHKYFILDTFHFMSTTFNTKCDNIAQLNIHVMYTIHYARCD